MVQLISGFGRGVCDGYDGIDGGKIGCLGWFEVCAAGGGANAGLLIAAPALHLSGYSQAMRFGSNNSPG